MKTAIIDYGSGNLHSVAKAFERAAHDNTIKNEIIVTDKPDSIAGCDRVVLPGVGTFTDCRAGLEAIDGMIEALDNIVIDQGKPFLGICVGAQLMSTRGLEGNVCAGFNWIEGETKKIEPKDKKLKIPQIGWNTLCVVNNHPLLNSIKTGYDGQHVYFVHTYHINAKNRGDIIAECDYGDKITAIVGRDNMIGTQFHPEKSQKVGLAIIANFLKWNP